MDFDNSYDDNQTSPMKVRGKGGPSKSQVQLQRAAKKVTNFQKAAVIFTDVKTMEENLTRLRAEELTEATKIKKSMECYEELEEELLNLKLLLRVALTATILPFEAIKSIKAMRLNPTLPIKIIMEAICVLKGIEPWELYNANKEKLLEDYWIPSKRLLTGDFTEECVKLKNRPIPIENQIKFEGKFVSNPNFKEKDKIFASFPPSLAVYEWLIALNHYHYVLRLFKEKKRQSVKSKQIYEKAKVSVNKIRKQIVRWEERLKIENEKNQADK